MTSDQQAFDENHKQAIEELEVTLRDVIMSSSDNPSTVTERIRAALALAALNNAVANDGTPLLKDARIDFLCKIINGEAD